MKHDMDYSCIREDCGGMCFGCTLGVCRNCGTYEGGLATECPMVKLTDEQVDDIYNGRIDFVGGQWVTPKMKEFDPKKPVGPKSIP